MDNSGNFSIYNASAGSGKTYTLTREYLKIILVSPNNEAYRKILAITFTNKAVNEMKTRIVESLFDFSKEEVSDKSIDLLNDLASQTNMSVADIKIKSKSIIKSIIHNYASFDISTIDKFTHRLIRTFAIDLGLPITFEVSLDQSAILQEAVDRIIAKAGVDEELTKVLLDFALNKTDDDKSWDITRDLNEKAKLLMNENFISEVEEIKKLSLDDFNNTQKHLIEINKNIYEHIINISLIILQEVTGPKYKPKTFISYYINYLTKLSQGTFEIKEQYFNPDTFLSKVASKAGTAIVEENMHDLLAQMQEIEKWIGRYLMYKKALDGIAPLSVINSISKEVALIQQEKNILAISEFNKIINEQIQNQPVPFIYERLGDRYRDYFIDEFQDTSQMQWENLVPLVDNTLAGIGETSEAGSLMIVGDPKQSIYRFRGGKAEQFIDLSKEDGLNPFSNPNKTVKPLDTNYRSYSEVINFNNGIFKFLSSQFQNPDFKDLYQKNSFQKTNKKVGGFVSVEFIPEVKKSKKGDDDELSQDELLTENSDELNKNDLYLLKTFETIQKVISNGFNLSDIAILIRNKKEGVLIANYLTEREISIVSSETLLLNNSDDVTFILNVLKLIKNFTDKDAKVEVLYYIAKYIIPVVKTHDFIADGMKQQSEIDLEYYIQQHTSVLFKLEDYRKKPLYEICEQIISDFTPEKATNSYVHYFLDIVLERDVKLQLSYSEFLEYWSKNSEKFSVPAPEGLDSVQILTIHKSKGLEFPVVIYPFAEEALSTTLNKDKVWLELVTDQNLPLKKILFNINQEIVNYSNDAKFLYNQAKEQMLLDVINVLYVALTRAGEQLYIITNKIVKSEKRELANLATFFIDYLKQENIYADDEYLYTFGSPVKISKNKEIKNNTNYIENISGGKLKSSAIKIAMKDALMWGSYRADAIEFGNMVHELLSFIKYHEDIENALQKGMRIGLLTKEFYAPVKYILENVVNHQELKEHFDSNNIVFNEKAIIKMDSNTIKPDRVTIYKRKATLLEYKTGSFDEAHIKQIKEYEIALTEMGYEVIKKSLLYIGDKIEIVNL